MIISQSFGTDGSVQANSSSALLIKANSDMCSFIRVHHLLSEITASLEWFSVNSKSFLVEYLVVGLYRIFQSDNLTALGKF
jgi:hypothetical protein